MVLLRVAALDSDPYARLSWSTGLLTDEGYYIHNARNLVLFGVERTDDFNNMLIMPTLHAVQVVVFRMWGAGVVQARWISVVCSLLSVLLLFAAVRRAFGMNVALCAALFNGLDHTNLLYNRMALMDTPAEMLLIAAFYAWVRGSGDILHRGDRQALGAGCEAGGAAGWAWLAICGAMLALAFATRGLAVIVIPAAVVAAYFGGVMPDRSDRSDLSDAGIKQPIAARHWRLLALCAGLAAGLAAYAALWYLPHREEIARVNHYYLGRQILPSSLPKLLLNVANAWFGDERGAAPFLMRHTPVLALAAAAWLNLELGRGRATGGEPGQAQGVAALRPVRTGWFSRTGQIGRIGQIRPIRPTATPQPTMLFALLWLAFGALFLSVTSYSPSRYYLLFYPPLAIFAACAVANAREAVGALLQSKPAMIALGGYVAYHAALAIVHHATPGAMALVGAAAAAGGVLGWLVSRAVGSKLPADNVTSQRARSVSDTGSATASLPARLVKIAAPIALACWVLINAGYYFDWATHLEYNQRAASQWITENLPANTVLIGDVAPGVALYHSNMAISVIPGLCNDRDPIERFAGKPRAIVILDGPIKERWWTTTYPDLVEQPKRTKLFPKIGRFPVGIYQVPSP
jgi:4-amino-4-deoxy-L-arabinose transferase-like glycosyltransferase